MNTNSRITENAQSEVIRQKSVSRGSNVQTEEKTLLLKITVVALSAIVLVAYFAYNYGYKNGYDSSSYNKGYRTGYDDGYDNGIHGEAKFSRNGCNNGCTLEYNDGYNRGYKIGAKGGYDSGYEIGVSCGYALGLTTAAKVAKESSLAGLKEVEGPSSVTLRILNEGVNRAAIDSSKEPSPNIALKDANELV